MPQKLNHFKISKKDENMNIKQFNQKEELVAKQSKRDLSPKEITKIGIWLLNDTKSNNFKNSESGKLDQAGLAMSKSNKDKCEEDDFKMCGIMVKNIEKNLKMPTDQLEKIIDEENKDQVKFSTAIIKETDKMFNVLDNLLDN